MLHCAQTVCIRPRNAKANGAAENKVKIVKKILKRLQANLFRPDDERRKNWVALLPLVQVQ